MVSSYGEIGLWSEEIGLCSEELKIKNEEMISGYGKIGF